MSDIHRCTYARIKRIQKGAKKYYHVYFDTSGSERVLEKDIQEAIKLFGYEHMLFGTDTPFARIEDQINKVE